ncbi:MAG: histidine kinase dimerization/phospho-acceptor domain-containing protein [bacterium]|nr:histidine kinase dimerization/phospho-acceptor domain-containing protein [bacterium]
MLERNTPLVTLVVEDDLSFLKILEIRLRGWYPNLDLTVAHSLSKAREWLEKKDFELLILDQHLPDGIGSTLLSHPGCNKCAVMALSADDSPELPGNAVRAGATHFLGKRQITEPLFTPLLEAILARKQLEMAIVERQLSESRLKTIKVLLATLRHEINNPLGAVLGGTYLMRSAGKLGESQIEALRLIEDSSHRIKHVLERLCETADLEEVTKGTEKVFHVPGDDPWS